MDVTQLSFTDKKFYATRINLRSVTRNVHSKTRNGGSVVRNGRSKLWNIDFPCLTKHFYRKTWISH